jgi:hypothetical protein
VSDIELRISSGVRAPGLRWRPWLPQQSFASGESRIGVAWSIGRASRLTGRGAAGWKLRKSTCETRCGTGCNEGAPLELAAQLPSDAQRTQPRCGARRREAFQIRLPADGGASTATAALPEALDAQRVGVPRAERSRRCCSVSGQPLLTSKPVAAGAECGRGRWRSGDIASIGWQPGCQRTTSLEVIRAPAHP